ncbi:hypothetical protein [Methylovirgula sp. 4M-Z18]|uniref:hypothetical protein n=1 Tax=Methylovirgula sp. 4M-Z18 TaxID=2293567 RepID=UPI000E2FDA66|nr:hypothetical protein [Methylovirgula sp. 4M-Z18]RFB80054.1 hypothetical protein DYH55_00440 [Methylovirgula sp. 4M-Z18]
MISISVGGSQSGEDWTQHLWIPVLLFVLQQLISAYLQSGSVYRKRLLLLGAVIDEIEGIIAYIDPILASLREGFTDDYFATAVSEPGYYLYTVEADSVPSFFRTEAADFLFLTRETYSQMVRFHNQEMLALELIGNLTSDPFKNLPARRKLAAIRDVVTALDETRLYGQDAKNKLNTELLTWQAKWRSYLPFYGKGL